MPRIQSKVSSGLAGEKGAAIAATGTDVGPQSSELRQRKGNSQAGAAVRQSHIDARGLGAPVVLDVPPSTSPGPADVLHGHNEIDFSAVHGPVRPWSNAEHPGGGKKTRDARSMIRKGRD